MSDAGGKMTEQMAENALLKLVSRSVIVVVAGALAWAVLLLVEIDKRDAAQTQSIMHIHESIEGLAGELDRRQLEIYQRMDEKTKSRYTSEMAAVDRAKQSGVDNLQNEALSRILQRLDQMEARVKFPPYWGQDSNP